MCHVFLSAEKRAGGVRVCHVGSDGEDWAGSRRVIGRSFWQGAQAEGDGQPGGACASSRGGQRAAEAGTAPAQCPDPHAAHSSGLLQARDPAGADKACTGCRSGVPGKRTVPPELPCLSASPTAAMAGARQPWAANCPFLGAQWASGDMRADPPGAAVAWCRGAMGHCGSTGVERRRPR